MRNILELIIRYGNHLLFVILELLCFYLIITFNTTQRDIFLNSTSLLTRNVNAKFDTWNNYLNLESVNDSLLNENKRLLEQLIATTVNQKSQKLIAFDSILTQYELIPATVCNKTIYLRNNHLTLCEGSNYGISPNMGVISSDGVVGIVKSVSPNYAHVISTLHSQSRISCAIKGVYNFGDLIWRDRDPTMASLEGVPKHTNIAIGDTILTSGYSAIFPSGIPVGKIQNFSLEKGSNNYDISVQLFNDLATTQYVYVIKNKGRSEQINLEAQ